MADNNLPPDPSNYDTNSPLNRFAKEDAKSANEIAQAARSLTEELKDQLGIRSRLNETQKETLNLARSLQRSAQENTVEIGNSGNIERQIAKDKKTRLGIEREINDLLSNSGRTQIDHARRIFDLTSDIQKKSDELAVATGDEVKKLEKQINQKERMLYATLKTADADTQRLALLNGMVSVNDKLLEQRFKEAEIQKDINDKMGVTGALVKGTGALMERLGMRSGIFQDAMKESAENMREMAEETVRGTANFSKLEIMLKGFSTLSKGFGKALFDPFTIATAILDTFFKINKQSVEISRLTGQSAFTNGILEFESGAASALDRMEVLNELTKELGMNAQNIFSKESLQGAANLKVEMGLAGKEAGNLAILAQTSGTSVGDLTDNIVSTTSAFNGANRSAVSQGVILRDIGNTSEGIRASFAGNTQELVEGAAAARRLGMSIDELDSIASSLLDFESSIESELEAQLLTGKNINMSKARELALSNDLAGLGKELMKNSSDIHDFGKMNRIQQEAQAKALGLTRDQLAKVAYNRALELGMTNDQAAAAANVNAEDMKRLTAQENFTKAIEKITTALAPILNFIGDILSMPFAPYILLGALAVKKLGGNLLGVFGNLGKLSLGANKVSLNLGKMKSNAQGFFKSFRNFKPKEFISGLKKSFGMGANIIKDARLPSGYRDKKTGQAVSKKLGDSVFGGDKTKEAGKKIADTSKATKAITPGKNIKVFLNNLGQGLKSMAGMKVLQGALNLIPAAVGLVAMIPGTVGAKLMEVLGGPKLLLTMQSMAQGLTAMGTGKVLLGALGLTAAALAFTLMIPASAGMALMGVTGPMAAAGILALIPALEALGTAMLTGVGALGLVALIATAVGMGAAFALIGAGAMMFGMGIKFAAEGVSSIFSQLGGMVELIPSLYLLGGALMSIGAGLALMSFAGIGALPVLGALSLLAFAATPLLALGGLFGDGEEEDKSMAEISSKLDTLISVVSAGGNVYLDGDKVGEAQVLGTYKLS